MPLRRSELREFHYITPMANVPSIVRLGILSHRRTARLGHVSIALEQVQDRRARKVVHNARPLHEYANLYFDARNPMMYLRKGQHLQCCVLRVSTDVLDIPGTVIADGNAADGMTRFNPVSRGLALLDRDLVFAEWWTDPDPDIYCEKKRVRCAEVLVPDRVPPELLLGAYVSCPIALRTFTELDLTNPRLPVTILERMFFR